MTPDQVILGNKYNSDFISETTVLEFDYGLVNIPETAKERYEVFGSYPAKWFFLYYKRNYLMTALSDDDIYAVKSELEELNIFKRHEQFNDQNIYKLYGDALKYILHQYPNQNGKCKPDQEKLFIYILLYNGYFEKHPIPINAMSIFAYNEIAKVYGKYFLFYDYLKAKLQELELVKIDNSPIEPSQPTQPPGDTYQFIKDTLKPLSGNWTNRNEIMSVTEFERLLEYTIYTFENTKLPGTINKIKYNYADIGFIQHTFYLIYKNCQPVKKIKSDLWINFLVNVFPQFEGKLYIQKHFKEFSGNYPQLVELLEKS